METEGPLLRTIKVNYAASVCVFLKVAVVNPTSSGTKIIFG